MPVKVLRVAPTTLRVDSLVRYPLQFDSSNRSAAVEAYNPSVARVPPSIAAQCGRCAFVAVLRVDGIHQCQSRPHDRRHFFRGTALAVLDAALGVVAWTWLLPCPEVQVGGGVHGERWVETRWAVAAGSSGAFEPPWAKPIYDARLLNVDADDEGSSPSTVGPGSLPGSLLLTYNCKSCEGRLTWSELQLTAEGAAGGGLAHLRAWVSRSWHAVSDDAGAGWLRPGYAWATGRNQAYFAVRHGPRVELLVQPWLGLVASYGEHVAGRAAVRCVRATHYRGSDTLASLNGKQCSFGQTMAWKEYTRRADRRERDERTRARQGQPSPPPWRAGPELCGPTALGSRLELATLAPDFAAGRGEEAAGLVSLGEAAGRATRAERARKREKAGFGFRSLRLLLNESAAAQAALLAFLDSQRDAPGDTARRGAPGDTSDTGPDYTRYSDHLGRASGAASGHRLSASVHLVRVSRRDGCDAYLGIGHLHRGYGGRRPGERPVEWRRRRRREGRAGYRWGYDYAHFFYTISSAAPHRLLGASADFCLGGGDDGKGPCESVQFVSGLVVERAAVGTVPSLLLSWGVSDCEAKAGRLPMRRMWRMLRPLPGIADVCERRASPRAAAP